MTEIVNVVTEEVASNEFERIAKFFRIEISEDKINENDIEDFQRIREEIIQAIQDGAMFVNEDGAPVYVTECQKSFTFRKLIGSDFVRLDKYKEDEGMHKGQATVASMTKSAPKEIAALGIDDWQFLVKVAGFLLASKKRRSRRTKPS